MATHFTFFDSDEYRARAHHLYETIASNNENAFRSLSKRVVSYYELRWGEKVHASDCYEGPAILKHGASGLPTHDEINLSTVGSSSQLFETLLFHLGVFLENDTCSLPRGSELLKVIRKNTSSDERPMLLEPLRSILTVEFQSFLCDLGLEPSDFRFRDSTMNWCSKEATPLLHMATERIIAGGLPEGWKEIVGVEECNLHSREVIEEEIIRDCKTLNAYLSQERSICGLLVSTIIWN